MNYYDEIKEKLLKNEIYAKHGRMFRSEELTNYFEEQVWYLGTVSPDSFSDSVFNSYESANRQCEIISVNPDFL